MWKDKRGTALCGRHYRPKSSRWVWLVERSECSPRPMPARSATRSAREPSAGGGVSGASVVKMVSKAWALAGKDSRRRYAPGRWQVPLPASCNSCKQSNTFSRACKSDGSPAGYGIGHYLEVGLAGAKTVEIGVGVADGVGHEISDCADGCVAHVADGRECPGGHGGGQCHQCAGD